MLGNASFACHLCIPLAGESTDNVIEDQYFNSLRSDEPKLSRPVIDSFAEDSEELTFIDRQYFVDNPNIEPLIKSKINFKFRDELNQTYEENEKMRNNMTNTSRQRTHRTARHRLSAKEVENSEPIDLNVISAESPLKEELFSNKYNPSPEEQDVRPDPEDYDLDAEIKKKIEEQKEIKLEDSKPVNKYKRAERTGAQYLEDIQTGKDSPHYKKLFTPEVKRFRSAINLKGDKLDSKGKSVAVNL